LKCVAHSARVNDKLRGLSIVICVTGPEGLHETGWRGRLC